MPINNDNRCLALSSNGPVGQAYSSFKYAFEKGFNEHMLLIEYDDLISDTEKVFKDIYEFIEQPYFAHSFSNISTDQIDNSESIYGISDMNKIRPTIQNQKINVDEFLSENIRNLAKGSEFWREDVEVSSPIEPKETDKIHPVIEFNLNTNDTKLIY
jgi:hypothetical protein